MTNGKLVAVLSQKGGVGKSTISAALAVAFKNAGWVTTLADADHTQNTSHDWSQHDRDGNDVLPTIPTTVVRTATEVTNLVKRNELTVVDGSPHLNSTTQAVAATSDLIVMLCSDTKADLRPTIRLYNLLTETVDPEKIIILIYRPKSKARGLRAIRAFSEYAKHVCPVMIQDLPSYADIIDEGGTLLDVAYDGPRDTAKQAMSAIVSRFNELTQ